MFVNDCGPEADLLEKNILATMSKQFHYFRNDENLGFVRTCNRAVFELDGSDNNVLLLNSDTKVTKGFLEEMIDVLNTSERIAAVCPRSNSATVFSVPVEASVAKKYSMKDSYKVYKKIKEQIPRFYVSPIAHGFCMLIRRTVIKKYGLFDEIFGKGYGEENDFCLRARRHGYDCAIANRAFVFHYKARSFTKQKRDTLVAKNEKILDKRYPEYRKLMQDYWNNIIDPAEWREPRTFKASRFRSRFPKRKKAR
jgi:GT2 family glycosyltransferase